MLLFIKSFIKHRWPNREVWLTFILSILSTVLLFTAIFMVGILSVKYEILETLPFSNISNPLLYGVLCSLFITAIPEEVFKLIIISQFCMRRKSFNNLMDGIVYGAAISIGFATIENIFGVFNEGIISILGGLKTLLLHTMLGGIMGYHLSKSRLCKKSRYKQILLAFAIPCGLHTLHNFPSFFVDSILANGYNLFILFYFLLLAISLSSLIISFRIVKKYLDNAKEQEQYQMIDDIADIPNV